MHEAHVQRAVEHEDSIEAYHSDGDENDGQEEAEQEWQKRPEGCPGYEQPKRKHKEPNTSAAYRDGQFPLVCHDAGHNKGIIPVCYDLERAF